MVSVLVELSTYNQPEEEKNFEAIFQMTNSFERLGFNDRNLNAQILFETEKNLEETITKLLTIRFPEIKL